MTIKDKEYKEHNVFSELASYIDFYDKFSMSVMSFGMMGTTDIVNMDTYVYSSIQGTIDSIKVLLGKGRINDSYCLLRKYYDSVIINIYSNLYIEDNCNAEKFLVDKVNNWLHGKDQLPRYRVMSAYIRNSEKLYEINKLIHSNNRYKSIRSRCNDHTHYNYFQHMLVNDSEVYIENRIKFLDELSADIKDIFVLHLSYIFSLNDHYMMSSDYVDYLDCGMQPPEGSQYWVSSFIKKVFDDVIKECRPDIALVILSNTSMQLSEGHSA